MKGIIELFHSGSCRLVMTTIDAGRVGASYETDNLNRTNMLSGLGLSPNRVRFVSQQHSRAVVYADEHSFDPLTEADGIIAGDDAIAVTVADCMPVFLYDEKNRVRALLHSGWKGTGIALEALEKMRSRWRTDPCSVTAVLGPAIGSCCYNVDRSRADSFAAEWGDEAVVEREGVPYLSLKNANRAMLSRAGVGRIICSDICTSCDGRLGSFRREGAGNFTQMMVVSYLNVKE